MTAGLSHDLTVACVLWCGKFRHQRHYNEQWVRKLRAMVARNLSIPHNFVCLSNVSLDGIHRIPLELGLPGWWSKLELFKLTGKRILYLDLDVLVTGSLDEIAKFDASIALMPPHHRLLGIPEPTSDPSVIYRYQTSCMVWSPPAGYEILSRFTRADMDRFRGDQDWIATVNPGYVTMPLAWFRKLRQCTQGPEPGVKVVLSMPWKNEEASRRFRWVRELWRSDGDLLGAEGRLAHSGH